MIIKKLTIAGLRAYKAANFDFEPGMNLLVGINGVGKTTVLDALRICLSQIQPEITASKNRKESFTIADIKIGSKSLQVSCDFEVDGIGFNLLNYRQQESFRIIKDSENIREQTEETPDKEAITPSLKELFPNADKSPVQPIGIFYSTKRSLIADRDPGKSASSGGQAAAFADALSANREFNLRTFADWFRVQQVLERENPEAAKNIQVLTNAIYRFMPGFSDLKVDVKKGVSSFTITKSKVKLNINQLSDGERGVLSLVLDIAKRLAQANPGLEDPLTNGKGVILIDELDLHLHPKWQRSIVENLTGVFPNCQFIATSHSPQIIPSLPPEQIQIISNNDVIHPDRSLGMDSNWILKYLMEADERPDDAVAAIGDVENLVAGADFEEARELMAEYKKQGMDFPEWSVLEARITRLEIIAGKE